MLNESTIRGWVGDQSFNRSRAYVRDRSIFNTRRQGSTLKAQCYGSSEEPYNLWATLNTDNTIAAADCSCPVGDGGHCKHVAALLLTWIQEPELFYEVEPLDTALARRSREELIVLIKAMLSQVPELELLLELPPAGQGDRPLDPNIVRRQVAGAFDRGGNDWNAASIIARSLEGMLNMAEGYCNREDWSSAATIYATLSGEIIARSNEFVDEEGELLGVLIECAEGLGECLSGSEDAQLRAGALSALFEIYRYDTIELGGTDAGMIAVDTMLANADEGERATVAVWVEQAMPAPSAHKDDWSNSWRRKAFGELLARLQSQVLDDETFLRICRESGNYFDLARRLIERGRAAEVPAEVGSASDYDLLRIADLLIDAGRTKEGVSLVRARSLTSVNFHLRDWLMRRLKELDDREGVLAVAEERFWSYRSIEAYDELAEAARAVGRWEQLRPNLLARLDPQQQYILRARIYLREGEIAAAIAAAGYASKGQSAAVDLLGEVAHAAESAHPDDALELYGHAVETLIARQGRPNYAEAAQLLLRMREIYRRQNNEPAWSHMISSLREHHRRLRALQEEIDRVRL